MNPEDAIVGTWSTPTDHGRVGMAQFSATGSLRTWAEPRPAEGSNLGRATYFIVGDSLGLIGELMDTTMYAMLWADRDHVLLRSHDKRLSLTRTAP